MDIRRGRTQKKTKERAAKAKRLPKLPPTNEVSRTCFLAAKCSKKIKPYSEIILNLLIKILLCNY